MKNEFDGICLDEDTKIKMIQRIDIAILDEDKGHDEYSADAKKFEKILGDAMPTGLMNRFQKLFTKQFDGMATDEYRHGETLRRMRQVIENIPNCKE